MRRRFSLTQLTVPKLGQSSRSPGRGSQGTLARHPSSLRKPTRLGRRNARRLPRGNPKPPCGGELHRRGDGSRHGPSRWLGGPATPSPSARARCCWRTSSRSSAENCAVFHPGIPSHPRASGIAQPAVQLPNQEMCRHKLCSA